MNNEQVQELLLQSLEHERGGIAVYQAALQCALNNELRAEWEQYLSQTQEHEAILIEACNTIGLDSEKETPGRQVVRLLGKSLVEAMTLAKKTGKPEAAELVACECVVLAETKDHADWELIGKCVDGLKGGAAQALANAHAQIETQEDEHLYHTKGWCRELWLKSLGLKAVLPPPEEVRHVTTAIGAARAQQEADKHR